jgi:hypothetical protein
MSRRMSALLKTMAHYTSMSRRISKLLKTLAHFNSMSRLLEMRQVQHHASLNRKTSMALIFPALNVGMSRRMIIVMVLPASDNASLSRRTSIDGALIPIFAIMISDRE